jgi:hypothetical protein
MKAKPRLASKAKSRAVAMAAKFEAMAKQAQADIELAATDEARQDAQDAARIYWNMAADWHATATRAEEISPAKFSAKNKGPQSKTADRQKFLRDVAREIDTTKHEAVAAQAIQSYSAKVFRLWSARGQVAESKLLNFMRNHGF